MSVVPFDRRTVEIWSELGAVPDDLPTREYAARMCAHLLHEYDQAIAIAAMVCEVEQAPDAGQGELFGGAS